METDYIAEAVKKYIQEVLPVKDIESIKLETVRRFHLALEELLKMTDSLDIESQINLIRLIAENQFRKAHQANSADIEFHDLNCVLSH